MPGERLGILLRERCCQRHRRHRAHQGEGRDDDGLVVFRDRHQAVAHRGIEAVRRIDRDHGEDAGFLRELLAGQAAGDRDHVDAVERVLVTDRGASERRGRKRGCWAR